MQVFIGDEHDTIKIKVLGHRSDHQTKPRGEIMTQPNLGPDQECDSSPSQSTITIDPKDFFDYASSGENRWQDLLGLNINHCTFGLGTINKVEGEYIYVDLPQRQGKKNLTEFGLESFLRGFFSNLQINNSLHEKIIAAAEALKELQSRPVPIEEKAPKKPPKKRKVAKAAKAPKVAG